MKASWDQSSLLTTLVVICIHPFFPSVPNDAFNIGLEKNNVPVQLCFSHPAPWMLSLLAPCLFIYFF